jgi:hypothetical protein
VAILLLQWGLQAEARRLTQALLLIPEPFVVAPTT